MMTVNKYENLRTIEGCEQLADLNATVTDGVYIKDIAENLKIPEENRFININPTSKELSATYLKILKLTRKYAVDGENTPHVLFVYVGGHGAS